MSRQALGTSIKRIKPRGVNQCQNFEILSKSFDIAKENELSSMALQSFCIIHYTVDEVFADNGDILLASGSQDSTVRLWRFHPPHSHMEGGHELFHVEESTLSLGSHQMAVGLESVLQGHDGRVYGVRWHPLIVKGKQK